MMNNHNITITVDELCLFQPYDAGEWSASETHVTPVTQWINSQRSWTSRQVIPGIVVVWYHLTHILRVTRSLLSHFFPWVPSPGRTQFCQGVSWLSAVVPVYGWVTCTEWRVYSSVAPDDDNSSVAANVLIAVVWTVVWYILQTWVVTPVRLVVRMDRSWYCRHESSHQLG